jgi:hypothetical protein
VGREDWQSLRRLPSCKHAARKSELTNQVLQALGCQIGVIRDFRPWDQDFVQRAGATAAGADDSETGDRFLPPADL